MAKAENMPQRSTKRRSSGSATRGVAVPRANGARRPPILGISYPISAQEFYIGDTMKETASQT